MGGSLLKTEKYYSLGFVEYNDDEYYFKGICYFFGYGVDMDRQKAVEMYSIGVRSNNAKCMYSLAVTLKNTEPEKSQSLFSQAFVDLKEEASCGDEISQRMISCYYLFGDRGVKQNIDKAKKWLLLSAENDDPDAQFNLAGCYENGEFFEKNPILAKKWYSRSALLGNTKSAIKLMEMEEASYEDE